MKRLYMAFGVLALSVLLWFILGNPVAWWFQPTTESEPSATSSTESTNDVEVVANDLEVPWGVDFLPGGNILVTERTTGQLLEISTSAGIVASSPIASAEPRGEGGLLGVAIHPDFRDNNYIYVYETTATAEGLENRVLRFNYQSGSLSEQTVIIDNISGAFYHDGGRLAFGPDRKLYITTGDAGNPELSQATTSREGKILRLNSDGTIPEDNPFGNSVYSYGHRNPQGLTWDRSGRLFSTEHGRSGVASGLDEVNLIKQGGNYGWPYLEGDETCQEDDIYSPSLPADLVTDCEMLSPLLHSGPDITWAPASVTYVDDQLFFGGLRGQALYVVPIMQSGVEIQLGDVKTYFKNHLGRVRTVVAGPNKEFLYVTTSNTDGRGQPESADDKLIRVPMSLFR